MWAPGIVISSAVAIGSAAIWPGFAGAVVRSARGAIDLGIAVNRAVHRQAMSASAEAFEVVEDLVAEAKAMVDAEASPRRGAPQMPQIIAGRAVSERQDGAQNGPRPAVDLSLVHAVGSRLRLRLRGPASEAEMGAIAEALEAFPGVRAVRIRPLTGCILVEAEGSAEALSEALESAEAARLTPQMFRHPVAMAMAILLARLDDWVRFRSKGRTDLRRVIALSLKAAELVRARARARAAEAAGSG